MPRRNWCAGERSLVTASVIHFARGALACCFTAGWFSERGFATAGFAERIISSRPHTIHAPSDRNVYVHMYTCMLMYSWLLLEEPIH